jgi:tripartite-type tricarboxylate transporter receptor subunit TctC
MPAARLLLLSVLTLTVPIATACIGQESFYKDKTIDFIVGGNPGGGYDIYARTVARHLARFIPGNPDIVVKNMPGAGSAKAAAFLYSQGKKDGTNLGAVYPGAIMDPLLGEHGDKAQYDPTKFQYIGTADNGTRMCITWHTSKTKTYEDAMQRKTVLGASQAGGSTRDYAYMQNKFTGTKFNVVSGYKGSVDILIAMERGEVEGMCGYDWSSLKSQRPDWIRDKKVNILAQIGVDPEPTLTKMGVPKLWQYIKNEDDRKVVELVVSQQIFGRPYFVPPGTPADRVSVLRNAFSATVKDKGFIEDAKKTRIDVEPLDGAKVQETVERLYATPKNIVEKAKQAIMPQGS